MLKWNTGFLWMWSLDSFQLLKNQCFLFLKFHSEKLKGPCQQFCIDFFKPQIFFLNLNLILLFSSTARQRLWTGYGSNPITTIQFKVQRNLLGNNPNLYWNRQADWLVLYPVQVWCDLFAIWSKRLSVPLPEQCPRQPYGAIWICVWNFAGANSSSSINVAWARDRSWDSVSTSVSSRPSISGLIHPQGCPLLT